MTAHLTTKGHQKKTPHPIRLLRNRLSAERGTRVTQPAFANELGVSLPLINAIESSRSRPISIDLAYRILIVYGEWIHPTVPLSEVINTLRLTLEKAEKVAMAGSPKTIDEHCGQPQGDFARFVADEEESQRHIPMFERLDHLYAQRDVLQDQILRMEQLLFGKASK